MGGTGRSLQCSGIEPASVAISENDRQESLRESGRSIDSRASRCIIPAHLQATPVGPLSQLLFGTLQQPRDSLSTPPTALTANLLSFAAMATGLNASLRFGPAPQKVHSSAGMPVTGGPPSTGGTGGRPRRGYAEAWQAECLRVADQLGAAVPEEEEAAPSSEWRAQLERVLAAAAAAEARGAPRAALSPAELDSAVQQVAAADPTTAAPLAVLQAEHKKMEAAVGVLQQELSSRREYAVALEQELAFLNKAGVGRGQHLLGRSA